MIIYSLLGLEKDSEIEQEDEDFQENLKNSEKENDLEIKIET